MAKGAIDNVRSFVTFFFDGFPQIHFAKIHLSHANAVTWVSYSSPQNLFHAGTFGECDGGARQEVSGGALYQLVCHDCSPAGWNFDISYSPSITGILMSLPLPPHIKVNSQILFRPLSP